MDWDELLSHLHREMTGFQTLLADTSSESRTRAVPACPGWTVADLGDHLAQTHRWAARCVRTGDKSATPAGTLDPADPAGSYFAAASELLDVLRSTAPDTPVWTFGPRPKVAAFWARRQAHETAIHRFDLAAALNIPVTFDPTLAADGIDEVLEVFFPRQVAHGLQRPLEHNVRLAVTDEPGNRQRVLHGDGTRPAPQAASATLRGPAATVLLALYRRIDITDSQLSIDGDPRAATRVFAANLTP